MRKIKEGEDKEGQRKGTGKEVWSSTSRIRETGGKMRTLNDNRSLR